MITQQPAQPHVSDLKPAEPQVTSPTDNSYVDDYQPPAMPTSTPPTPTSAPVVPAPVISTPNPVSVPPISPKAEEVEGVESLQDQNIFYLLGVDNSDDNEKEAFLDELQQVIWEDFIETDVKMLVSDEEMTKLRQMMSKGDNQDVQEEMVVYLEKLIPDLEEIMLEKALELKEDMFWERVSGMREYHIGKSEFLTKIDEADRLAKEDKWHQAAELLNSMNID
ncbi:MAG: hypothetical protein HN846_01980 [Candidatus Pacebacteria bacterium]|jgi:hypothetical protein|nr:hypothetical protein [Candidatus Paceibacterota bacterium]MBT3512032.1 hypothetical protein [Candidatus Paceibacterota bacterium]MBT4004884.1 hypothetical protein [Candidatus Paceibacterota bacterium]MBT4359063.1 hypothetical protein [Candidatus Paceibacterota bacterium]MBT4680550.1 hypothetical protein [Candidatus Paceibacterota bacterium]